MPAVRRSASSSLSFALRHTKPAVRLRTLVPLVRSASHDRQAIAAAQGRAETAEQEALLSLFLQNAETVAEPAVFLNLDAPL
jgi:hypothetical protein